MNIVVGKQVASKQKYAMEKGLVVLRGEQTQYTDGSSSEISYWIEIDGARIPGTSGFASTEAEFKKKSIAEARTYIKRLIGDVAGFVVGA